MARRRKNFYLYNAMNKHGISAFNIEVLESVTTIEELNSAEVRWVRELGTADPHRGYNMTAGGDGCPAPNAETRYKIGGAMRGRSQTKYQKDAVRRAHSGKPKSASQRQKMASWWDEDRRDQQGEVAKRVNAIENAKLKDYTCVLCNRSFVQVKKGVFGGHRKACMARH